MKQLLEKGKSIINSVTDKVTDEFTSGISVVTEVINGLPIFVSSES